MSGQRYVHTVFWEDEYIAEKLDPIEKLLYLYFLTNPFTNIAGIYEITIRRIAIDTGIEKDMVRKILSRFEQDGKICYRDGFIAIKNFIKRQKLNTNMMKGVVEILREAPQVLREWVCLDSDGNLSEHIESLLKGLKGYQGIENGLNYLNLNLNSIKSDKNSRRVGDETPPPPPKPEPSPNIEIKPGEIPKPNPKKPNPDIKKFIDHWHTLFLENTNGQKYKFDKKSGGIVKTLLKGQDLETAKACAGLFFTHDFWFTKDKQDGKNRLFSLPNFIAHYNAILSVHGARASPDQFAKNPEEYYRDNEL